MRQFCLFFLFFHVAVVSAQYGDYKSFNANIRTALLMQHAENKFWYNPAPISGGEDKIFTFALSPNHTANSYNSVVCLELPSKNRKNAFAFQVSNYRLGIYRPIELQSHLQFYPDSMIHDTVFIDKVNLTEAAILYSKSYYFGAENKISFGVQFMFRQFRFIPVDPDNVMEPRINIGEEIYKPDLNIGIEYSRKKFFAGFSLRNIFTPGYSEINEVRRANGGFNIHYFNARQHLTAFFTAGNSFTLNDKFKLQSSALIITDNGNMLGINLDFNNTLIYNEKAKIGFSLRDPSIYNVTMGRKFSSRKDIPDKHTFHFTNFAVNTGYTFDNTDIGAAFNFQDYTGMNLSKATGWQINAVEFYLKARI
ncbi:MAG: type IX secretion system membrane protein PorP/SprF [Bacteroidia bacterium]